MRGHLTEAKAALLLGCLFVTGVASARRASELGLPNTVEVQGKRLVLNGASIQKKLWFEIYLVGLYVETPARDAKTLLANDEVKRIHLKMLRDVSSSQLREALQNGLEKSGVPVAPVQQRLNTLFDAIPNIPENQDILITYIPGKGTVLEGKGCKPVQLEGKDFADAMFSLWLGADPGVARIKRELLVGPPKGVFDESSRPTRALPASTK